MEYGIILAGRYRVDHQVAEGGFGSVYAGRHLVLDVPVAIKVPRPDRFEDPAHRARYIATFLEEARTLARLRHPNIVSVLDAGVQRETSLPWMVLEWCEGRTLKESLDSGEVSCPMSPHAAWKLLRPIAAAMAHAHHRGIAHRDLKPSNIVLVRHGGASIPRVLDFGVAKTVAEVRPPSGDTRTRDPIAFTPAYAAPEQVVCGRTGPWTDVHGLALLLVELISGRPPYGTDNPLEAAVSPERPTLRASGIAVGAIERVLEQALALKPGVRPPDAGRFLTDVDEALGGDDDDGGISDDAVLVRAPVDPAAGIATTRPVIARPSVTAVTTVMAGGAWRTRVSRRGVLWSAAALLGGAAVVSLIGSGRLGGQAPLARAAAPSELQSGSSMWQVQDGTWRVEGDALLGTGGQIISSAELGDGTLELDFELVGDRGKHAVGVGFRANPGADSEDGSGYGVNFALGTDTFNLFKGTHGLWKPVDPAFPAYHPSPAVDPRKNHVVVRASGNTFVITVNGQHLATFADDAYPTGRITLWVASKVVTVRFSNIRIGKA